ncbi:3-phosphonopyruvate decarboxylase [Lysinibacillus sphaericus]|nr:phosphonopyruvate decarboxylase [Lysinibacillus sphaericus]KEK10113.1 3-phosphonopyruvate decarboxylase [Lysinibacillus sphaericus]
MLAAQQFGEALNDLSYDFYSGVPCSFLKYLINYAINEQDFIMAANEGDAVAICSGAYLGGRKPVFLCQNSGLANAVSPLTSLTHTFKIPVLGFVSLRGEEGLHDEPQHELMGQITGELLATMRIPHAILSTDFDEALQQLKEADAHIERGESYFFIVKKGTFGKVALKEQSEIEVRDVTYREYEQKSELPTRLTMLSAVKSYADDNALVLATTGLTGRELYELGDTANQLYMVGSMGCVSSIALGLAVARPDKKVIVIDGDGALLMRLGTMATLGYYAPMNLYHLLLDNAAHESTGAQFTVSSHVDFLDMAKATKYHHVFAIDDEQTLKDSLQEWDTIGGLTFAYSKTSLGVKDNLGRPSVTPAEVKSRFMQHIKSE